MTVWNSPLNYFSQKRAHQFRFHEVALDDFLDTVDEDIDIERLCFKNQGVVSGLDQSTLLTRKPLRVEMLVQLRIQANVLAKERELWLMLPAYLERLW